MCSISGIINTDGTPIPGDVIIKSIASMHDRSNGLGGGFAGYGIYPGYKDLYAFHLTFTDPEAKQRTEEVLKNCVMIHKDESIPTEDNPEGTPIFWRYFIEVPEKVQEFEEDFVVDLVMKINSNISGACVISSGKDMGIFKGVGYPEDIGRFYRIDEYSAHMWTAHGRFPTNTHGSWEGAHPFGLLDWSVVHNGEISSYGINRRYIETFGYGLNQGTDTEVVTYLVDMLIRKHKLSFDQAATVLAPPFWDEIERLDDREMVKKLRIIYSSAQLNGPFSIIIGHRNGMVGLNDRTKLRPMTVGRFNGTVMMASEECAIRAVSPDVEDILYPRGGEPVIIDLEEHVTS